METVADAYARITADAVSRYNRLSPNQKELSQYALEESRLDAEHITKGSK